MASSDGVGDGVLLSDPPGTLPAPLSLGEVALALIVEGLGLQACSPVTTEGGGHGGLGSTVALSLQRKY